MRKGGFDSRQGRQYKMGWLMGSGLFLARTVSMGSIPVRSTNAFVVKLDITRVYETLDEGSSPSESTNSLREPICFGYLDS